MSALLAECEARGLRQIVAVIGDSANCASIGLHKSLGFREVGVLRSVGFKFGRWVDSLLMQRIGTVTGLINPALTAFVGLSTAGPTMTAWPTCD